MERTFDVIGIAKQCLIIRGLWFSPKQKVEMKMKESEYSNFKDNMDIIKCEVINEIQDHSQKSESIVIEEPKIEPQEEVKNDKRIDSGNIKNTSKKKSSVSNRH